MKKKTVFRIQLTPAAKSSLNEVTDRLGITQIHLSGQLLEWFAMQPDTIKAAVLGLYPAALRKDIARLILETTVANRAKLVAV